METDTSETTPGSYSSFTTSHLAQDLSIALLSHSYPPYKDSYALLPQYQQPLGGAELQVGHSVSLMEVCVMIAASQGARYDEAR